MDSFWLQMDPGQGRGRPAPCWGAFAPPASGATTSARTDRMAVRPCAGKRIRAEGARGGGGRRVDIIAPTGRTRTWSRRRSLKALARPGGRNQVSRSMVFDRELAISRGLVCDEPMEQFIAKHSDEIEGALSCFDRVLFRGYLPFFSGAAMATFLDRRGVERHALKSFLLRQAYLVKGPRHRMADRQGRPFQYFGERVRREELARQIAERDGIHEGLVCVLTTLEPCRTFSLHWSEAKYVQSARRKCLFVYYYFMDREFGLIHVRIQTWFPLQIQVQANVRGWNATPARAIGKEAECRTHPGLRQRPRMAGSKAGATRNPIHQGGQRVPRRGGFQASASVRRSFHQSEVDAVARSLGSYRQPFAAGPARTDDLLLGHRAGRVRDGHRVQEPRGARPGRSRDPSPGSRSASAGANGRAQDGTSVPGSCGRSGAGCRPERTIARADPRRFRALRSGRVAAVGTLVVVRVAHHDEVQELTRRRRPGVEGRVARDSQAARGARPGKRTGDWADAPVRRMIGGGASRGVRDIDRGPAPARRAQLVLRARTPRERGAVGTPQSAGQPSPPTVFPSSQVSPIAESTRRSPQSSSPVQSARQPSPALVLPSSQASRPSRAEFPHVAGGVVPLMPALLRGAGAPKTKLSAQLSVSSVASRRDGEPAMSRRRTAAQPSRSPPLVAWNGVPTPAGEPE